MPGPAVLVTYPYEPTPPPPPPTPIDNSGANQSLFQGNDTIVGGAANDTLHGFNGNDLIFGNRDKDYLYGDNGNDILIGGSFNPSGMEGYPQSPSSYYTYGIGDNFRGGSGSDSFVFMSVYDAPIGLNLYDGSSSRLAKILDFNPAEGDKIVFGMRGSENLVFIGENSADILGADVPYIATYEGDMGSFIGVNTDRAYPGLEMKIFLPNYYLSEDGPLVDSDFQYWLM